MGNRFIFSEGKYKIGEGTVTEVFED